MSISSQADFYLNFQQFDEIKLRAKDHSDEAARSVAQQFEGLFVQQMLAAMRSASNLDAGQHSSYMDFYQEMYDRQLAQSIAKQDRLGVARLILQQMPGTGKDAIESATALDLNLPSIKTTALEPNIPAVKAAVVAPDNENPVGGLLPPTPEISTARSSRVLDDDFAEVSRIERANSRWHSPERFIADILPQAQAAADTLGISARLLLAQSALETGWGKYTLKFADGRSSNNLFAIKAGPDWRGSSVQKASLEFRDGILQSQVSSFRAYATPAQSLADYVEFIQTNPRYQQALKLAGDDQAFIREIHSAGYATDPRYADKVLNILNGEVLQRSLANLNAGVADHA